MKNRIARALSLTGFTARVLVAVALVGVITSACDVHGLAGVGTIATVTVTPNATLTTNGTQQMVAEARDADGRLIAEVPTWSVVSGGGTITSTGLFTAGSVTGLFANTVEATFVGLAGNASITVIGGPLVTIVVTPNPVSMGIGETQTFIAVGRDAAGNVVQFTPTWSVVAGGGTVNDAGLFTAGTVTGTYGNTVQASNQGIKGAATVTVTAGPLATITVTPNPVTLNVNLTQQFTAVGKDASGNVIAITPVWSVATGGGTITVLGLFTAGTTPGTSTVRATSGAISGSATVNVTAGVLATITVSPNPATLVINTTQPFLAVGRDAGGNVVAITPTWAVAAGGGAINPTTGVFTAGSTAGTFTNTIRASVGGLAGFATVIVASGPLASITVTPNPVSIQTNDTQQFIAVGRDASGNVFLITPAWSVVNGGGIINATSGVFTAGLVAGTFNNTIVATSGAISGTATVIVTAIAPALATITVTPNPASMLVNATQQFAAVGRDAGGTVLPIAPVWSVVNGGGTIDANTGLFTAGAVGGTFTNTVRATSGAIFGSATVNVTAPIVPSPLGSAKNFGILAGAGITCAISGTISGASGPANIGSSPTATYTGFAPPPAVCTYTGVITSPAVTAAAKGDLTVAYLAAQGQVCDQVLTGTDLGFYDGSTPAKTLAGDRTYCFSTSAALTGTLRLTGSATAKWTFQIGSTLNANVGSQVILAGGAIPDNVYWAVGSSSTLLTNSQFQGTIMALASITLQSGATLLGRALAQVGAVDMTAGGATIIIP